MNKKAEKVAEINPFLFNFEIRGFWRSQNKDGEKKGVPYFREYDTSVSVYQRDLMPIVRGLKGSAPIIFFYILAHLGDKSQKIRLNYSVVAKDCGISLSTYRRGLEDLKAITIIVKARTKDMYWVNPNLCFRGDRLATFPDNIRDINKPRL